LASQRPHREYGRYQAEDEECNRGSPVQTAMAVMHSSDEEVAVAYCTDEGGRYDDKVLCGEVHKHASRSQSIGRSLTSTATRAPYT
jgi:hypothetical protein